MADPRNICDGAVGSDDGFGGRLRIELETAWKDSLVVTCLLKIKVVIIGTHRGDKHASKSVSSIP